MRLFHILSPCNTHIFKTQFAGRCAEAVQKQSGLDYRPGPPNIGCRSVQCIGYRLANKHSTPTHSHWSLLHFHWNANKKKKSLLTKKMKRSNATNRSSDKVYFHHWGLVRHSLHECTLKRCTEAILCPFLHHLQKN